MKYTYLNKLVQTMPRVTAAQSFQYKQAELTPAETGAAGTLSSALLPTPIGPLVTGGLSALEAPEGERYRAGLYSGGGQLAGQLIGSLLGSALGSGVGYVTGNESGFLHAGNKRERAILGGLLGAYLGNIVGGGAGAYLGHKGALKQRG